MNVRIRHTKAQSVLCNVVTTTYNTTSWSEAPRIEQLKCTLTLNKSCCAWFDSVKWKYIKQTRTHYDRIRFVRSQDSRHKGNVLWAQLRFENLQKREGCHEMLMLYITPSPPRGWTSTVIETEQKCVIVNLAQFGRWGTRCCGARVSLCVFLWRVCVCV